MLLVVGKFAIVSQFMASNHEPKEQSLPILLMGLVMALIIIAQIVEQGAIIIKSDFGAPFVKEDLASSLLELGNTLSHDLQEVTELAIGFHPFGRERLLCIR